MFSEQQILLTGSHFNWNNPDSPERDRSLARSPHYPTLNTLRVRRVQFPLDGSINSYSCLLLCRRQYPTCWNGEDAVVRSKPLFQNWPGNQVRQSAARELSIVHLCKSPIFPSSSFLSYEKLDFLSVSTEQAIGPCLEKKNQIFSICTYCSYILLYVHIDDFNIFVRFVQLIRLYILNRMHNLQSWYHPPKNSMLLVEPRRSVSGDEELRAIRVWSCIRHANSIGPTFYVKKTFRLRRKTTHRSCFTSSVSSSSNSLPQIDIPPVPSPRGSPVWIINLGMTRWNITPSK